MNDAERQTRPDPFAEVAAVQRILLIHLHFHPVEAAADMAATRGLSVEAYSLWKSQFDLLLEYAVDAIAEAIAPHLPLPPEVEAV